MHTLCVPIPDTLCSQRCDVSAYTTAARSMMASSLQIFVAVLVLYVAVVNILVVRSLRVATVTTPTESAAPLVALTALAAPPTSTPRQRCHDGVVYVAVVVPPTANARDNAPHAVLSGVRRAVSAAPSGMRVHLLLVGVRASGLHTHQQWCTPDSQSLPCSLFDVESSDPRLLFRRAMAEFECIQDLVLLGVNARVDLSFFERLDRAPRDKVTCLTVHNKPVCPAYRVSVEYMQQHPHNTDIASGAKAEGMYFGEQPVLA